MPQIKRYETREDISVDDIDEDRKADLQSAFERTVYGERIHQCVAAAFEVSSPIEKSGVVVGSWLHHERLFDMVSAFSSGSENDAREFKASATVIDQKTGDELSAHVSEDRVLISVRSEDTTFESFAAYVLFLEQRLHVDLTPILD